MKKMSKIWKQMSAVFLSVLLSLTVFSNVKAADSDLVTITVQQSIDPYAKDTLLNRVNQIRYEAYQEGLVDRYVPIKWSSDLEEIAMQRAAEATCYFSHTRLDDTSCFTATSSSGERSFGEILATPSDMMHAIDLWYAEKSEYVRTRTYSNSTGHYYLMINPNNVYIGLASFGVSAGEFGIAGFSNPTSENQIYSTPQTVRVNINLTRDRWNDGFLQFFNGWVQSDGQWYYYQGMKDKGWLDLDGTWYYLDENTGAMATGWRLVDGTWYYLSDSGAMVTGWKNLDGTWYFLDASGAMATGWRYINGVWYYFDNSGAMATGWRLIDGTWYYLTGSGAMATGWLDLNGTWYYLDASGAMAANEWRGGYWLDADGAWRYPATGQWYLNGRGWWYQDTAGWYPTSRYMKVDGVTYWFNAAGYLR